MLRTSENVETINYNNQISLHFSTKLDFYFIHRIVLNCSTPRRRTTYEGQKQNSSNRTDQDKRIQCNPHLNNPRPGRLPDESPLFSRVSLSILSEIDAFVAPALFPVPLDDPAGCFFSGRPTHKYGKINTQPTNPKQAVVYCLIHLRGYRGTRVIKRARACARSGAPYLER